MAPHRVRRTPVFEKIRSFPFDTFLWLNEHRLSIDWDTHARKVALPLGALLSIVFYGAAAIRYDALSLQQFYRGAVFSPNHKVYERVRQRAVTGRVPTQLDSDDMALQTWLALWLMAANCILATLTMACVANFVSLYFFSYRSYTLLYHSGGSPSLSARRLHLTNSDMSWWSKFTNLFVSPDMSYLDSELEPSLLDESYNEINLFQKDVWQLQVWDPSRFSMMLSATFSPPLMILIYIGGGPLPFYTLIISYLAFAGLSYLTIQKFLLLVADKQILYQEMFQEYNKKFVLPKTSVLRKDAIIDATLGPRILAHYTVQTEPVAHLHTAKLKVFMTHDINGKAHNTVPKSSMSRSVSPAKEDVFPRLAKYKNEGRPLESPFRTPLHPDPRLGYQNRLHQPNWITLSTPYRRNSRNELQTPFRLRPHSPSRQLSPGRNTSPLRLSSQLDHHGSRLPSPSKSRPRWQ